MQLNKRKVKSVIEKVGLAILSVIELKVSYKATSLFYIKEIKEYNQVLDDYVELLNESNIEEPTDIFNCFSQTLWNGYFSADQTFNYNINRKLYFDNYGLGCISGEAVCINNADMLTDIFNKYGYDASTIMTKVNINNIKPNIENIPVNLIQEPIENNILREIISNLTSYITGNHAITAVRYKGEVYYFDPTNLCYLKQTFPGQLEVINGEGQMSINYFSTPLFADLNISSLIGTSSDYDINKSIYLEEKKLIAFYEKEKAIYQDIKDSCRYKNSLIYVIFNFCILLWLQTRITSILTEDNKPLYLKKELDN